MGINTKVRSLADVLKTDTTIDENGNPILAENAYEANLPEGLTMELRNKFDEYDSEFVASAALAFSEKSAEQFKENKELQLTRSSVQMGAGKLNLGVDREHEALGEDGEKTTIHNWVTASYKFRSTHLAEVCKHMSSLDAEAASE